MTMNSWHTFNPESSAHNRRLVALAAMLIVVLTLIVQPIASAQNGIPERDEDRSIRIYDTAELLSDRQEESLTKDLNRSAQVGVEIIVYTRTSTDTEKQSQAFADQLRSRWAVESAPDANNGLVFLVTVNEDNPKANTILMASGSETFPIRQLDQAALQGVLDTQMKPALQKGDVHVALAFGIRKVINQAEYSPPNPAPLTDTQQQLNKVARILGAVLIQVAVAGYFLVSITREGRLTWLPNRSSLTFYAVVIIALAIATGVVAIAGRNGLGAIAALATFTWGAAGVPLIGSLFLPPDAETDGRQAVRSEKAMSPAHSAPLDTEGLGQANG